jgi:enoyl-CoA hydratase
VQTGALARAQLLEPPLSKPVVCAINGAAVAGGFELMLGTDIRIASSTATFGVAEVRRGLLPGGGGISRLPRQVARVHALELLLTGSLVDAERALAMGLVNAVVLPEELPAAAERIALEIAEGGPFALRQIKAAVNAADGLSFREARAIEDAAFQRVLQSKDAVEGSAAFVEKRSPCFTGA